MKDGLRILDQDGAEIFVSYDDLDSEVMPQLLRPVGGFCYEASIFKRLELPSVPFYVKDWLPKAGKCLLYGQAKAGKSYLSLQLARCIGTGAPFLGLETQRGRVLYVQFELAPTILQLRMNSTGQDYEEVFVGTTFSMKLDVQSGKESLIKSIDAVNPDVLIIDPLRKVLTGEEKESYDVGIILDFFDDLIEAYGCSIVVVHHGGKDLSKGSRGTSILSDWPDAVISVEKTAKGTIKLMPTCLRHAELPPEPIKATFKDFEFVCAEESVTVMSVLEDYINDKEVVTSKELLELGVGSQRAIYKEIKGLIDKGRLERTKQGIYIVKGVDNGN